MAKMHSYRHNSIKINIIIAFSLSFVAYVKKTYPCIRCTGFLLFLMDTGKLVGGHVLHIQLFARTCLPHIQVDIRG